MRRDTVLGALIAGYGLGGMAAWLTVALNGPRDAALLFGLALLHVLVVAAGLYAGRGS
jgi:hypothetical protein